jgi:hypothetical protein
MSLKKHATLRAIRDEVLIFVLSVVIATPICMGIEQCGAGARIVANPRAAVRGAVDVAKDAFVVVGRGCVDASKETANANIAAKCAEYLDPAYTLISDASAAVDTDWSPKAACGLAQATALVAKTAGLLGAISPEVMPVAADAAALASALLGSAMCALDATDAGSSAASDSASDPYTDAGGQ